MAKRNLDSAPLVHKYQETERNVVQGGRRVPRKAKKEVRQVESAPVKEWVSPNGDR